METHVQMVLSRDQMAAVPKFVTNVRGNKLRMLTEWSRELRTICPLFELIARPGNVRH